MAKSSSSPTTTVRTMRPHHAILAVALAAVTGLATAAGCGGGAGDPSGGASSGSSGPNGPGGGPDGNGDWKAACEGYARFICETLAVCDAKDFAYGSVDECLVATKGTMCGLSETYAKLVGVDVTETLFTPGYQACFEKQQALGPACRPSPTVTAEDVLAARAACSLDTVLGAPTKQIGDPCANVLQCPREAACLHPAERAGCGTCTTVTEGQACEGRSDCGLLSGFDCENNTCVRSAKLGESCETKRCDQLAMLVCGTDKKCGPLGKLDEPCDVRGCDGALFLYCSTTTKTCKTMPRNPGDSCQTDGVCGPGLFCDKGGACRALLGENAPCTGLTTGSDPCDNLLGLGCHPTSGTCTLKFARVGEKCRGSFPEQTPDCWQSHCEGENAGASGTCVKYALSNESCATEDAKCAQFLFCVDKTTCKTLDAPGVLDSLDAGAALDASAACL